VAGPRPWGVGGAAGVGGWRLELLAAVTASVGVARQGGARGRPSCRPSAWCLVGLLQVMVAQTKLEWRVNVGERATCKQAGLCVICYRLVLDVAVLLKPRIVQCASRVPWQSTLVDHTGRWWPPVASRCQSTSMMHPPMTGHKTRIRVSGDLTGL